MDHTQKNEKVRTSKLSRSPNIIFSYFKEYLTRYEDFNTDEMNGLDKYWSVKVINKSNYFFKEGDNIDTFGFIIRGAMKLISTYKDKDVVTALLTEGSSCNMKKDFNPGFVSAENAFCIEHTILVTIKHQNISKLITQYPVFSHFFSEQNEKTGIFLQERLRAFQVMSAKERYDEFFIHHHELLNRFNLQNIASYLGMKGETLSRIRSASFKKAS
ncbi:MAG: cyclic nucleotide-binding protein [Bacteroidota bacterium]|nr:cyclic nucleotide-binding protein [Bacteroidota bacterium]